MNNSDLVDDQCFSNMMTTESVAQHATFVSVPLLETYRLLYKKFGCQYSNTMVFVIVHGVLLWLHLHENVG